METKLRATAMLLLKPDSELSQAAAGGLRAEHAHCGATPDAAAAPCIAVLLHGAPSHGARRTGRSCCSWQ